jgi:hypothetical protein
MIDRVTAETRRRLASLGFAEPYDEYLLGAIAAQVVQAMAAECNLTELPEGLYYDAVSHTAYEYLSGMGLIDTAKEVKMGDVSVKMGTPAIDSLLTKPNYGKYRRLQW